PPAPPAWLRAVPATALALAILGAWPFSAAWFALRGPNTAHAPAWQLDITAAAPQAEVRPPAAALGQALFFDQGEEASWFDAQGRRWILFYFEWERARAAHLGGVHVPELCLPAVGWVLEGQGPNLIW